MAVVICIFEMPDVIYNAMGKPAQVHNIKVDSDGKQELMNEMLIAASLQVASDKTAHEHKNSAAANGEHLDRVYDALQRACEKSTISQY